MPPFFNIVVNNAAPAGEEGATGTFQFDCDGPQPGTWSARLGWSAPICDPTIQQAAFDIPYSFLSEDHSGWPDGDYVIAALSVVPGSGMPDDAELAQRWTGFKFSLSNPPLEEKGSA